MYVRPEGRGTGIGSALLVRLIQEAESIVEELRLSVVTTNIGAKRLYEQAGFEPYGLERRSLKVGSAYHDEVLMALALPSSQSA